MDLVDEFGGGDHDENEARRSFASIKRLIRADYLSSDHVSHIVSKNISKYLTLDARKPFN